MPAYRFYETDRVIPKPGFVRISVYDLLGREITALVNEQ